MPASESNPDFFTCILSGRAAVTEASAAVRGFGESQWLTEDETARLCIVIEELVANLYDHGGVTHEQAVKIDLASEPGAIRIAIHDPGAPFDPRSATSTRSLPERGGNAGINIVRAWAMFVDYQTSADGNHLELLLPVGTCSSPG